ncbi:cysteine desulfurase family protein [Halobacillus sp. ACCC02827]|uniref:cysteine desulfurase family protein n=1 Tax=Bacillaceae TaxID=186817 RepID=UPI0002A4D179|nr:MULTISPECIES: cysteine desulfurase family protein [Bacillaceae]ELK47314.1 aminotransferase [Halobacillus sp. BAB-2008]QHT47427.1 cysteine desulfurase [Bacillus sp. SB49]WJE14651.1 cysteine desulfurase family protein [Halobacillus sp. ACCC02827]
MIYLDNSATTHPLPDVLDSYRKVADQYYANPSSVHRFGSETERLLHHSRKQAASLLGIGENEVVFTSGGTEGNNMAVKGIALQHQARGRHLVTSKVEHPSVLEAFRSLESLGFDVTYINVGRDGKVNVQELKESLRSDTILVSIMSVNNELGTVQPIKEIGALLKDRPKTFFHVDHVQGLGKVDMPIQQWGIDLCTVSGHKIHGLKGTGALVVRSHVTLFPLLHGGSQEVEFRAGTENLPGIVSFVKALRLLMEDRDSKSERLSLLRTKIVNELSKRDDCKVNSPEDGAPHIINFSIPGFKPEVVIHALGEQDIFISTKSACSSKQPDVSAVLKACNMDYERTTSALRVSLSYLNTLQEVETFLTALFTTIDKLKATMR